LERYRVADKSSGGSRYQLRSKGEPEEQLVLPERKRKKKTKSDKKVRSDRKGEKDIEQLDTRVYELQISGGETSEVPLLGSIFDESSEEEEGNMNVSQQEHQQAIKELTEQLEKDKQESLDKREHDLKKHYESLMTKMSDRAQRKAQAELEDAVQSERSQWETNRSVCEDISKYLSALTKKADKKDTKVAPLTYFSDATDDATQFINRLEQHFVAHDITDAVDKVNVALSYLKGGAYYRFFSEFKDGHSWRDFKKSFEDHYLSKQVKEIQRQTLVSKKMKPNEDFDQYLNNFLKLGKSAGLNDKALAQQLADNLPPLYQSHLVGVEKEKLDAVVEKVRIAIQAEDLRKQGNTKHVSALQCDEDLSQLLVAGVHGLGQRVEALSEKLNEKSEKAEADRIKETKAVRDNQHKAFKGNMRDHKPSVPLCFLCQKPGHFQKECYHNKRNQRFGPLPRSKPPWQNRRNDNYGGNHQWRRPNYRPGYRPRQDTRYQQPSEAPVFKTPVFTLANPSLQTQPRVQQGTVNVNGAVPQAVLPIEGARIEDQRPVQYIPVQQLN
jgi:hypothetical protein